MTLKDLGIIFRNGCIILFILWLNFSPTDEPPPHNISTETIVTTRGGGTESWNKLDKKKFYREMLKAYFPDWDDRVNYEKKQIKFYKLAMKRKKELKRLRVLDKKSDYTKQELDAVDYFGGTGFYKKHQNKKTLPNIYDTRQSLLLKMENKEMRKQFLKTYNRSYNRYKIVIEPNP